jgi:toxin ParE1/3/4
VKRLRVDPAAQDELRAAIAWYQKQRLGLGAEFHQEVKRLLELFRRQPEMGSLVPRLRQPLVVRRFLLRRFPFFIVYRETGDAIEILAFANTNRKPGYWKSRLS